MFCIVLCCRSKSIKWCRVAYYSSALTYLHTTRFSEGDGCQVSLCALCLLDFIFHLVSVALCWLLRAFGVAMFMLCASWLVVDVCVFSFEFSDQGVVFGRGLSECWLACVFVFVCVVARFVLV